MAAQQTVRCLPASWGTTCASTSSGDRRPKRSPPADRPRRRAPSSRVIASNQMDEDDRLAPHCRSPSSRFRRRLELGDTSVLITETVTNQSASIGRSAGPAARDVRRAVHQERCHGTSLLGHARRVFEHPFGPADYLSPAQSSIGPMRHASTAAWRISAVQQGGGVERLHRPADGSSREQAFFVVFPRVRAGRRIRVAPPRLSVGWGSGRRTAADRRRRGTSPRSRGDSSSAVALPRNAPRHDRPRPPVREPTYRWIPARTP